MSGTEPIPEAFIFGDQHDADQDSEEEELNFSSCFRESTKAEELKEKEKTNPVNPYAVYQSKTTEGHKRPSRPMGSSTCCLLT